MEERRNESGLKIDLMELAQVLLSKALVLIVAALIAGAAALGYTLFSMKPKYEATTTLYVNNSSVSVGSLNFSVSSTGVNTSDALVPTYILILKSRTTLEDVIAAANLNYTASQLSGMISAQSVSGTAVFTISVESENPVEAELIANTIAQVLPDRITEIVNGSSVRIVDYAIVPTQRSSPSYTDNTLMGMLIGLVLSAAVIVLQYIIKQQTSDVVATADDLKTLYPDIPVLALIPDMHMSEKKGYYYYSSYYGGKGDVSNG